MEALARDNGVSERTGWRWLQKGRVTKAKDGDGHTIFVMEDPLPPPTLLTAETETAIGGAGDVSEQVNDREFVTRPRLPKPLKEGTGEIIQPTLFPPDQEMIDGRKQSFLAEQIEKRVRAQRNAREMMGSDINPLVAEAEAAVKVSELSVRGAKAKIELKNLQMEEAEQKRKEERKELIERIKATCVPSPMKKYLPPDLLLLTHSQLINALSKLDLNTFTEEEATAFAIIERDKVWTNPQYYPAVKLAQFRALVKLRDEYFDQQYSNYVLRRESALRKSLDAEGIPPETVEVVLSLRPPMTYDQWYVYTLHELSVKHPEKAKELFTLMGEYHYLTGGEEKVREIQEQLLGIGRYVQENHLPF